MTTRKPVSVRLAGVLVASVVLAVVGGTLPAAAAPTGVAQTWAITVAPVDAAEDSVTVEDLRELVRGFEASGEVTFAGARRLEFSLLFAEHSINRGTPESAISALEEFKQTASEPRYVPSPSAQTALIAAADALIATLHGE